MDSVKNIIQFSEELEKRIKQLSGIDQKFRDRMIDSIEAQLDYLKNWSKNGCDLNDPKLKDLNFGLLAGKSIDDFDPQLGEDLVDLANYIDDLLQGNQKI